MSDKNNWQITEIWRPYVVWIRDPNQATISNPVSHYYISDVLLSWNRSLQSFCSTRSRHAQMIGCQMKNEVSETVIRPCWTGLTTGYKQMQDAAYLLNRSDQTVRLWQLSQLGIFQLAEAAGAGPLSHGMERPAWLSSAARESPRDGDEDGGHGDPGGTQVSFWYRQGRHAGCGHGGRRIRSNPPHALKP